MKITRDIKSATYLKSRTKDLLDQINETHQPVIVTQNGTPRAVIQDIKSYEDTRNALGIMTLILLSEEEFRQGKFKPQEEVFREVEKRLRAELKQSGVSTGRGGRR